MTDCNSSTTNCNDDPITVCTSLPGSSPTAFDNQCRDLAEAMCKAVVRYMEEYNRTRRTGTNPSIPTKLDEWMKWALNQTAMSGLPNCLDLTTTSTTLGASMKVDLSQVNPATQPNLNSASFTKRTYNAVQLFGTNLIGFDINDWHDE